MRLRRKTRFYLTVLLAAVFSFENRLSPQNNSPINQSNEDIKERLRFLMVNGVYNEEAGLSKGDAEKEYLLKAQPYVLPDLIRLYTSKDTKITYASFHADEMDEDHGFGLHVIRRLNAGDEKTILVNEHWPFDKKTGGLLLPDEIRARIRAFAGTRHEPGSAEQYLAAFYRIGWDGENRPIIFEQLHYDGNREMQRRESEGVLNCMMCHQVVEGFAARFAAEGKPIDNEVIVQPSYFEKNLSETAGFTDLMRYLKDLDYSETYIQSVKQDLLHPQESMVLPGFVEALRDKLKTRAYQSLPEDEPILDGQYALQKNSNAYRAAEKDGSYLDALEATMIFDHGKTIYWDGQPVIPRSSK